MSAPAARPAWKRSVIKTAERIYRPIFSSRLIQKLLGQSVCDISYVGRASGNPVSLRVWYRRSAEGIRILVGAPQHKTWWRNFRRRPHPIEVTMDRVRRTGTGLVGGDDKTVWVDVSFDR